MSRSTTLTNRQALASKCSTLIAPSPTHLAAALVGFGGLVSAASCRMVCRLAHSLPAMPPTAILRWGICSLALALPEATFRKRAFVRTVVSIDRAKPMAKSHLKLVTPATINRTVIPMRPRNSDLRTREYLTEAEVERLMEAAKGNRWGHRDATMILVGYRHGLRVSELGTCAGIRWSSPPPPCTSAGSSRAPQAPIRSLETNCGRCGGSSASRNPNRPSCSLRNAGRRLVRLASPAWSNGRAGRPSWPSRRTLTCFAMPAVMP